MLKTIGLVSAVFLPLFFISSQMSLAGNCITIVSEAGRWVMENGQSTCSQNAWCSLYPLDYFCFGCDEDTDITTLGTNTAHGTKYTPCPGGGYWNPCAPYADCHNPSTHDCNVDPAKEDGSDSITITTYTFSTCP